MNNIVFPTREFPTRKVKHCSDCVVTWSDVVMASIDANPLHVIIHPYHPSSNGQNNTYTVFYIFIYIFHHSHYTAILLL